jgi:NOP5NT (NUC127) domain
MVFILAETAAGYAIFKAKDKALKNRKTLADDLASVENATSVYDPFPLSPQLSWDFNTVTYSRLVSD